MQKEIDKQQNVIIRKAKAMTRTELLIFIGKNDLTIPIDTYHSKQLLEDRFCEIVFDKYGL